MDESDSLILAATNHPEILDYALFRRFDDVIQYTLPDKKLIIDALKARLSLYSKNNMFWNKLAAFASGLNYAEITRACEEAAKENIIYERQPLTTEDVMRSLAERKSIVQK